MNNHLPLLNFLTVYNKRGATQNARCPDKPLLRKAFRASFTLSAVGYIGPADSALGGNLPLCAGRVIVQAIAQRDNHPLPGGQAGLDALADLDTGVSGIQLLQHVVIHRDYIHQRQRPPIPRRLQGIRKGHLALELALGAEIHQDLICYPHTVARQDHRSHRPGTES